MKEELIKRLSVKTYANINGVDVDKLHNEVISFLGGGQRLPPTVLESLRDHKMFGMYIATESWTPTQIKRFVDDWVVSDYWPEYIEFVEKELSK